jgi:hypothetical protein
MAVYGHYSMKLRTLCGQQWKKSNPVGGVTVSPEKYTSEH